MIRVVCRDQTSRLGIAAILDIEQLANASCGPAGECNGQILFGKTDSKAFGILECEEHRDNILYVKISELGQLLSRKDREILSRFHSQDHIAIPCSGYIAAKVFDKLAQVLLYDENGRCIVLRKGDTIWSGLDVGASFSSIITEKYVRNYHAGSYSKKSLASNKIIQKIYYHLPSAIRASIQKSYYRKLEARLKKTRGKRFVTSYPVDVAGWFLIRLFLSLVKELDGFLVCLGKWRKPFDGAFAFTHDIEPTKFSYKKGLAALLNSIEESNRNEHMLDLVANHALKFLKESSLIQKIREYTVMSHGYYHDGAKPYLPYEAIRFRMANAKTVLEGLLDTRIAGYRSPRYERSGLIFKGVKEAGYSYSTTCPDIDRGNTTMYGAGVSVNYPFYHFVGGDPGADKERILEIPITSPDCIEPLFMGYTAEEMCDMYRTKLRYVKEIGGAYICIVHAGSFNEADIDARTALLKFLMKEVKGLNLWHTNLNEIYKWWRERENIELKLDKGAIVVFNRNGAEVKDVVITRETKEGVTDEYSITIGPHSQERIPADIL